MSMIAPYPHVEIEVEDKSIYMPTSEDILPLHRPLYIMRTQKGPIGVPVWCESYTKAARTFGEDTFNKRSKYFSPSAYFLLKQMTANGAFIMRAADTTAACARIFVECGVEEVAIPQWKRDEYGRFVLNDNGEKIAIGADGSDLTEIATATDVYTLTEDATFVAGKTYYTKEGAVYNAATVNAGGTVTASTYYEKSVQNISNQATIDGVKLTWRARQVSSDTVSTDYADLVPTTVNNVTWYPMFTMIASNAGEWGNAFGFKLFYSQTDNSGDFITRNKAVAYNVAPVQLLSGASTVSALYDKYNNPAVSAVILPDAIDSVTEVDISLKNKMEAGYSDGYELPCKFIYYSENFNTIGKLIMSKELAAKDTINTLYADAFGVTDVATFVEDLLGSDITDGDINGEESNYGFMVNIMSGIDRNKAAYFGAIVSESDGSAESPIDMDADAVVFLKGGTDGAISDPAIEEYTRLYLDEAARQAHDYLIDYARCPFNCIIDTGVSIATKKAYLAFMDVRNDLKVYLGTQQSWQYDASTDATPKWVVPSINDRYTDESVGAALRTYAWLMRESIAKGTECCRATIFLHAGTVSDWDRPLPGTLWIAEKLATYCNRDFMNKEPKELPNAAVECWKSLSWVASSEDTRSRCWNAGLNYVQYYSMTGLHYASVRSVYKYDTSVLVDDMFVNAITWMKHIVRVSWAKFAGATRPVAELQQAITEDLTQRIAYMVNGKYEFSVDVYQTDEDKKLGYVQHVDITVTSPAQNRVWLVNIICKREGYESEE